MVNRRNLVAVAPGALALLVLGLGSGRALGQSTVDAAKLSDQIRHLRATPDDQRPAVTKQIALDIRRLPAGIEKFQLAFGLANLATEGDAGRSALQAVTDTLAAATTEMPADNNALDGAYDELAQLAHYEGMHVDLRDNRYRKAETRLKVTDEHRATADFTLRDLDGKKVDPLVPQGQSVLVNFWATWCPPCRKEMPDLDALYAKFKGQGFVILAISDEPDTKVRPFIQSHGYRYPILLDPGRTVNTRYVVNGIPKSFLYDRRGHLVGQTIDMRTRDQFLRLLATAGLK